MVYQINPGPKLRFILKSPESLEKKVTVVSVHISQHRTETSQQALCLLLDDAHCV